MNALIIGAGGFVGGYLIKELSQNRGFNVCATKLPNEVIPLDCAYKAVDLDILNEEDILRVVQRFKPDCIYHLAAQSSVAVSWKNPALTVDVNIRGCVNVLEAVRKSGQKVRVILIGSSEEYGYASGKQIPISEKINPEPGNIYAVTKYASELIGKLYFETYGLDIIFVRAFNHIGPGQLPQFVISDFCKQTAEIEKGLRSPVIHVGNLSAQRDFTDVRDIVRAYGDLADKGIGGEVYNIGSGKSVAIKDTLDLILSLSSVKITIEVDKAKFRPVDIPKVEADISKLKAHTNWNPQYKLQDTVSDTLEYWRNKIAGV